MIRYKKIVAVVNYTESSRRALLKAQKLANKEDAKMVVVHCINNSGIEELRKHHDIDMSLLLSRERKNLGGYISDVLGSFEGVEHHVFEGEPFADVIAYCEGNDVDLLVIGSNEYEEEHSKNGIFSIKCVRRASMPVLLVKNVAGHTHKKVIVYTDLSDISSTLIAHAAKQSLDNDDELDVVNFIHPPWLKFDHMLYNLTTVEDEDYKVQYKNLAQSQLQSKIKRATEYLPITINPVVIVAENTISQMMNYLNEHDADMVVIGKTGEGWYRSKHPLGTTAEHVLRQADCSVLIIPVPEEFDAHLNVLKK
ncbi:MAG: nucleotide-binding universal stress UspA family protein [Cryomorphaceae bacterium]|jgi:nucleotide-binding universal stress UspA family protein